MAIAEQTQNGSFANAWYVIALAVSGVLPQATSTLTNGMTKSKPAADPRPLNHSDR